jgi:hypothetical protein
MIPTRRIALAAALILLVGGASALPAHEEDDLGRTIMLSANDGLRAQGMDYAVQQIDFFNRDGSRASVRYFQQEFRWVAGDPRRGSAGAGLTVLLDGGADGEAWTGVAATGVAGALGRALGAWSREKCLADSPLAQVPHPGGDVTVFDFVAGTGGFGDPFAADVVVAGLPETLHEFFGEDTLAFSVSFIFVGADGEPTDLDGDRHLDTALNEIYLNPEIEWTVGADGSGFDVETALLHELGHALGLGHFSPPPDSVMSPTYTGVERRLHAIDRAALCVVHGHD